MERTTPVCKVEVTERLAPVRVPAPDPVPERDDRTAAPPERRHREPARSGRRRRAVSTRRPGRWAELTVAAGGLLALLAFLAVPHLVVPVAGALTVPALIGSATEYEPAARLLWLIGAGATLVAALGATAAGLRGRVLRAVLLAFALAVAAVLGLGYLTVGVSALGPGGPTLAPGFALVALGLLTAFVAAIAGLMAPRPSS